MVQKRAYKVVDAFSSTPTKGNPVAVVLDAEGLSTPQMQAIAGWTNLSETTFVLPPTDPSAADYTLRIFTPMTELPFAGHPTVGSAHAMLESGRVAVRGGGLVQECGKGLVRISVDGVDEASANGPAGQERQIKFALPQASTRLISPVELDDLVALFPNVDLTHRPMVVDVGPKWLIAQFKSAEDLLALQPDYTRLAAFSIAHDNIGLTAFAPISPGSADVEVRSFAPADGVNEDPVCGSGNGSVAVFRRETGTFKAGSTYVASQGRKVGREGKLLVQLDEQGQISVGGACVTTVDGFITV